MKIALGVHQFLPDYYAGTEVLTYRTARELRERGHEVIIFAGFPAPVDVPLEDHNRFDVYTHDGFRVYRFLQAPVPMGDQDDPVECEFDNRLVRAKFQQVIKDNQIELVHFFHFSKLSASVIDACTALRIPAVFTATDFWMVCIASTLQLPDNSICSGPDPDSLNCIRHYLQLTLPRSAVKLVADAPEATMQKYLKLAQKGQPFFEKFFCAEEHGIYNRNFENTFKAMPQRKDFLHQQAGKLSRIIVPTKLVERVFLENGIPKEKMQLVPYGVEMDGLIRHHDRGNKQELHIGYIGTLKEHKGVHILLKAIRELSDLPQLKLSIYGDKKLDPDYTQLLEQTADGDSRITFKDTFEPNDIWNILSDFDAIVVPSTWYENTPLVVLSSQASGCPVLATDLDGMSEVIHHKQNGMLFPSGDSKTLASQIKELAENRSLLRKLSENCVMPSSIPENIDRLEAIFTEVLTNNQLTKVQ